MAKPKKDLKKRIRQLEARIQKDLKKLSKLKLKLKGASAKHPVTKKKDLKKSDVNEEVVSKKKRQLTPEGRARLAAAMKARWAARRPNVS